MSLTSFFRFDGYEVEEIDGHPMLGEVNVSLRRDKSKPLCCFKCGTSLGQYRGKHRVTVKDMPVFSCPVEIRFWRIKGHCPLCKKARSESVHFLSEDTPHLTKQYGWWLARLAEIAPVRQAARVCEEAPQTIWRVDFERLKRLVSRYSIPPVYRIAVDEVYSHRIPKPGESRDDQFFTIITDLDTKKVVWVSDSRRREALEEFFEKIGPEQTEKIEVVAVDQHEEYARAVRKYCPNAKLVWDRFHLMRNFLDVVNETRIAILKKMPGVHKKKYSAATKRFAFLKKDSRRSREERQKIDEALKQNDSFAKLELIKERMFTFFESKTEEEAIAIFNEIGRWVMEAEFLPLINWWLRLRDGWSTLRNYFTDRVTTALSEGINNVIKALKRRAYGFRNMEYFKLKIMQQCGYLNSKYLPELGGILIRGVPIKSPA